MKRKRHSDKTIIKSIKQYESGLKVADFCRELGIIEQTFYKWKAKYGGMEVSESKRLNELEEANARLKRLLADAELDKAALKEVLSKKW